LPQRINTAKTVLTIAFGDFLQQQLTGSSATEINGLQRCEDSFSISSFMGQAILLPLNIVASHSCTEEYDSAKAKTQPIAEKHLLYK